MMYKKITKDQTVLKWLKITERHLCNVLEFNKIGITHFVFKYDNKPGKLVRSDRVSGRILKASENF